MSGWYSYLRYDEDQDRPSIDRALLRRVWSYAKPYRGMLTGVLVTVLIVSGLTVVPPVLIRYLIDSAIPQKDLALLTWLGLGMVAVPVVAALVGVAQRWWSSRAGESPGGAVYASPADVAALLHRNQDGRTDESAQ